MPNYLFEELDAGVPCSGSLMDQLHEQCDNRTILKALCDGEGTYQEVPDMLIHKLKAQGLIRLIIEITPKGHGLMNGAT